MFSQKVWQVYITNISFAAQPPALFGLFRLSNCLPDNNIWTSPKTRKAISKRQLATAADTCPSFWQSPPGRYSETSVFLFFFFFFLFFFCACLCARVVHCVLRCFFGCVLSFVHRDLLKSSDVGLHYGCLFFFRYFELDFFSFFIFFVFSGKIFCKTVDDRLAGEKSCCYYCE